MIRTFVLCLSLLGLAILLSSAVMSFLALEDESVEEGLQLEAEPESAQIRSSQGSGAQRPNRPSSSADLLAEAARGSSRLSPSVSDAIRAQVSVRLGEFIDTLTGDDQRRAKVKTALTEAYEDAAQSAASSVNVSDSNFVVNALESILDGDELTQLETFLEDSSRTAFVDTYSPQLDLLSPELAASNKRLLLDTLFAETYAATNPNGNLSSDTSDFLTKQLDAIRLTRDSIRGAVQGEQFEFANDFLKEQEAGLNTALDIFSPAPK